MHLVILSARDPNQPYIKPASSQIAGNLITLANSEDFAVFVILNPFASRSRFAVCEP